MLILDNSRIMRLDSRDAEELAKPSHFRNSPEFYNEMK